MSKFFCCKVWVNPFCALEMILGLKFRVSGFGFGGWARVRDGSGILFRVALRATLKRYSKQPDGGQYYFL